MHIRACVVGLALAGCAAEDPETITNVVTKTNTNTTTNTTTNTIYTPAEDPCVDPGSVCVYAGIPQEALFAPEGLHRLRSQLYLPQDIEFAADGTPYIVDFNNHQIRRVESDDTVTVVTGTGMLGDGPEGPAETAAWNHPTTVAFPPGDSTHLYVSAWHNSRINLVDVSAGTVDWYAGTGGRMHGGDDGPREAAILDLPSGVAFTDDGTLYLADQANHLIRKIDPDTGVISRVAGQVRVAGYAGDGGLALDAMLHGHTAQKADPGSRLIAVDNILYYADTVNGVIRTIDLDSGIIDGFAGKYTLDEDDIANPGASVPGYSGDGGDALDAVFNTPRDLAMGIDGEVYIADTKNNCVRVVALDGTIDTFAGQCGEDAGYGGDGGPAGDAVFNSPFGVAVDADGNVYIADTGNHVIRRVLYTPPG